MRLKPRAAIPPQCRNLLCRLVSSPLLGFAPFFFWTTFENSFPLVAEKPLSNSLVYIWRNFSLSVFTEIVKDGSIVYCKGKREHLRSSQAKPATDRIDRDGDWRAVNIRAETVIIVHYWVWVSRLLTHVTPLHWFLIDQFGCRLGCRGLWTRDSHVHHKLIWG